MVSAVNRITPNGAADVLPLDQRLKIVTAELIELLDEATGDVNGPHDEAIRRVVSTVRQLGAVRQAIEATGREQMRERTTMTALGIDPETDPFSRQLTERLGLLFARRDQLERLLARAGREEAS